MSRAFALPVLLAACVLAAAATSAPAAPVSRGDSTTVDRWTLANGLDVTVRHIPGAEAVSITAGCRYGLDDDPADRPALARLLGEVLLTAPAGDVPERTREELESLRPQGWSLKVTRRHILLTEAATPAQFPGVLRQLSARLHGVTVTAPVVQQALATVRHELGQAYFGSPEDMLYSQVRDLARGLDKGGLADFAAARGLERETPARLQAALAAICAPANASLALAGDFRGLDLRALVESEFGGIPAGSRRPDPDPPPFDSVTVVLRRSEAHAPAGVIGIVAPALGDSTSPSFFMSMLLMGTRITQVWPPLRGAASSRFNYLLLDDPTFLRVYPPLKSDQTDPARLSETFTGMAAELMDMIVTAESYDELCAGTRWLLGGPLPPAVRKSVRTSSAALNMLTSTTASRALWGSEEFWAGYLRRFDATVSPGFQHWYPWVADPAHQARLLLLPQD